MAGRKTRFGWRFEWRFEWMIASRYVKVLRARGVKFLLIPVPILVLSILAWVVDRSLAGARHGTLAFSSSATWWHSVLGYATWIGLIAFWALFYLFVLVRRLSIFSSISTYGLFLGSAALVLVLSSPSRTTTSST